MSRKRSGPTPPRPWTPFVEVSAVGGSGTDSTVEDKATFWSNNIYFVTRRRLVPSVSDRIMIWLSIHRIDRKPIRDWRHLQRIKTELVGPECEGMEMFPAESRLVDTSNQYHLWVLEDPTFRWPWGYEERLLLDADDPTVLETGAVQRPFIPEQGAP